ncbi:MAG TPA: tRNA (adenosine(37)-N6)-threonylcarbamoyltransferase complex dimerization subunit type 1 TsaB [Patescibacteria group bacterium]|nr:tRNA (adenosine(37)-N6)-threonylcarbamoyltransferase complex dimerization subunit type 1 TsaB [Patescibacteria group bacterium]
MKILGVDTTTKFLALALYDNGKVAEYNVELGRRHSSLLVPVITQSLESLGLGIGDIDYFACGLGPGSFTGMRIGLAAIKGFAYALRKPVIGISTLDILAASVKPPQDRAIVPAIDAKRGLVYCSAYRYKKGRLTRIRPYKLLSQEAFLRQAPSRSLLAGDACALYKDDILRRIKGVTILDREYWFPQGRFLIDRALERIGSGKLDDPFTVKPLYLYPKECQIKTKQ